MAYRFEYTLTDEGNANISKFHSSEFIEDSVVVPDSIDGHPVLRISSKAFSYNTISDLYLPDSLLYLEYDSFYRFTGKIHIPYNVSVCIGFTDGPGVKLYTTQGSRADEEIKKRGANRQKIECIYEDAFVFKNDDITYFLRSDQTLDLVECNSDESTLSLPSQCNGYPVKRICCGAFKKCTHLETIFVPEGLEVIGYGAFSDLKHLKTVNLPESIHTIDSSGCGLFGNRGSNESVYVQSSLGSYAEKWCRKNDVLFQPCGINIVKENGLSFQLNPDGTAEVIDCDIYHQDVHIPSEIHNHRVLRIRKKTFEFCFAVLRTVVVDEGVRYIEDEVLPKDASGHSFAFVNGFLLRLNKDGTASVVSGTNKHGGIPSSYQDYVVTEIEKKALRDFPFEKLTIPTTIIKIGKDALPKGYTIVTHNKLVGQKIMGYEYFQGCIKDTITVPVYESYTNEIPIVHVTCGSYAESYCKKNKIPYCTYNP